MIKISEEVKKQHEDILKKSFKIIIEAIQKSNEDLDFVPIHHLLEDYIFYKNESFEGIIINECYVFLERIKKSGITEDNYTAKESVFEHAVKNIETLSGKNIHTTMLPRPSRVIYILKYYLYHHFDITKDIVKQIIDIVADKEPKSSRMPKNNEDLNKEIELVNDIYDYKFNSREGKEKWKYFVMSIFSHHEFQEFRNLVYDDNLLNKIIEDEFSHL